MAVTYDIQTRYQEQVVPALLKEFNYENVMQVPRIQ
ncbi:MAG: 50S ribosomal protein L5, partial [Chloroflexi bacterium]|nr:50S ribosomal protein L5 [Chloroflexota bacterium]